MNLNNKNFPAFLRVSGIGDSVVVHLSLNWGLPWEYCEHLILSMCCLVCIPCLEIVSVGVILCCGQPYPASVLMLLGNACTVKAACSEVALDGWFATLDIIPIYTNRNDVTANDIFTLHCYLFNASWLHLLKIFWMYNLKKISGLLSVFLWYKRSIPDVNAEIHYFCSMLFELMLWVL